MEIEMKVQHRGGLWALAWICASIFPTVPTRAQADTEGVVEFIHSSLPLYTFEWQELWPRSSEDGDGFGCRSRIGLGDWRFTPAGTNGQEEWHRFSNYGAFHCAAVLRHAYERAELESAQSNLGFFVRLGSARHDSRVWELWALQRGSRPGSEYTLLAREANDPRLIVEFRVLQQRCPRGMIREVQGFDVWRTRYCAIGTRTELLSLARRMLRLPAIGTIARVSGVEGASD